MLKKVAIIVSIVLVIGLGVFIGVVQHQENKQVELETEWQEERLPFQVQLKEYEQEMVDLANVYEADLQPKATVQFLFTDLSAKIYTECYPDMQKMNFTGVLAVAENQLPGDEGCLTKDQFKELVENGWTVCVLWEEETNSSSWFTNLKKDLEKVDVEKVTSIYFPQGTYETEYDAKLKELGFGVIICGKGDNESPLQLQHEEGIWHAGAIGFMSLQPKIWLNEAIAQDANITFTVGFENEKEAYNEESFDAMLKYCQSYDKSGDLMVGSLENARNHYAIRVSGLTPEQETKYKEEKAAIEAKIAEVEEQLAKIDARYGQ